MTKLYVPESYPPNYEGNGCGSGLLSHVIPDSILFVDISEACKIHDFMYQKGLNIEDKKTADRAFLNNMLRLIDNHEYKIPFVSGILKKWRYKLAGKYYEAVVKFGGPFYWWGKNPAENLKTV